MKSSRITFLAIGVLGAALAGGSLLSLTHVAAAAADKIPLPAWAGGETLRYKLMWPSSMSLGEGVFRVSPAGEQLQFELTVEASLPVKSFSGSFRSRASRDTLCSVEFEQKVSEGTKNSEETIEFDQKAHQARITKAGGTDSFAIPECARDPLSFLYYFRAQLAAGKWPDTTGFFIGPAPRLQIRREGTETISAGGVQYPSEVYEMNYRGSSADKTFEVWVSTDARRAPVRIQLPFPLATFSAELQ
jgi:hypothetical protein